MKAVLISLVLGALATTIAEYKLGYNFVDYLKGKALALYAWLKAKL